MDDTFVIFNQESECDEFLKRLNSLHKSLQFTSEKESNNRISFLDVLVLREDNNILPDVFHKPTFTGECMKWSSFCPRSTKTMLITTLVDRAVKICSPCKLNTELDRLRKLFRDNGFPDDVIEKKIDNKIKQSNLPIIQPKKCPIYFRLPYIGEPSVKFKEHLSEAVSNCYGQLELKCIFKTNKVPVRSLKDVLPAHCKSNVIYRYVCHCGCTYVGRTSQVLTSRMEQHVPKSWRSKFKTNGKLPDSSQSAIGQHLIENRVCAKKFSVANFSILGHGRNDYHLQVFEAIYITSLSPVLCRQKNFVLPLKIFRSY